MPFIRTYPRTTDTQDLSVNVLPTDRAPAKRRVLDLSSHGMLITAVTWRSGR